MITRTPLVRLLAGWLCWIVAAPSGCGQSRPAAPPEKHHPRGESAMKLTVQSTAFKEGQAIPKKYTEDGQDLSPPLAWSGAPPETKEFALICDDPDAPRPQPWVHWVIYRLPAGTTALPEGVPPRARLEQPPGALQGKNTWPSGKTVGYRGPAPPKGHGVHHYHFKVYALDTALDLPPELTKDDLLARIKGHVLAEGELIGTYQR
jgi:Raf kinase inhibitor-like YbhB/YbcL family protein